MRVRLELTVLENGSITSYKTAETKLAKRRYLYAAAVRLVHRCMP